MALKGERVNGVDHEAVTKSHIRSGLFGEEVLLVLRAPWRGRGTVLSRGLVETVGPRIDGPVREPRAHPPLHADVQAVVPRMPKGLNRGQARRDEGDRGSCTRESWARSRLVGIRHDQQIAATRA